MEVGEIFLFQDGMSGVTACVASLVASSGLGIESFREHGPGFLLILGDVTSQQTARSCLLQPSSAMCPEP